MNQAQQRFLLNRLDEARRSKPSRYGSPEVEEPREVIAARADQERAKRVIEKFSKQCERARKIRNDSIDRAFNKAKTAVLFATSEAAIKAIEGFEKTKF